MNQKVLYVVVMLFLITYVPSNASASESYEITSYDLVITPQGGTLAYGELTLGVIVSEPSTMHLAFGYPLQDINLSSDKAMEYIYDSQGAASWVDVMFSAPDSYTITLTYHGDVFSSVEETKYVYAPTFTFANTVSHFSCTVVIPESMSVVTPLVPSPHAVFSDGSSFVVTWEKADVENGFYLLLGIKEDPKCASLPWAYVLIALALCFGGGVGLGKLKGRSSECVQPDFKTDEAAIIGILSEKGPTTQSEIVSITGFSKAKVSRIIMELETRNVLEKERYKNRNIVKLLT